MLTVLGGLAEFERDLIRSRTTEGRARAKANGVKMGRPPKLTAHQKKEAIKRRDHGEETLAEIGRSYNVTGWTIARLTPEGIHRLLCVAERYASATQSLSDPYGIGGGRQAHFSDVAIHYEGSHNSDTEGVLTQPPVTDTILKKRSKPVTFSRRIHLRRRPKVAS